MCGGSVQYEDSYCLLKIKEGDENFFNLLFEKYRNRLFTYLFKITKSKETAEEIVLDVFLKLWNGRQVIDTIKNLDGFLFRVAYHRAVDFFRAASRDPKLQEQIWDLMTEVVSYETADQKLLENEIEQEIRAALKNLSPQRRKIYYLRNYEGLSYADIARRLNLSQNTVRNHLSASLRFIREFLSKSEAGALYLLFWAPALS